MSSPLIESGVHPKMWIPRQKIDPSFSRWIRREFGPEVAVGWDPQRRRFLVGTYDRKLKQRIVLVVIETPEGEFLPLNGMAQELVVKSLVHNSKYRRQHELSKKHAAEQKVEEREEFREYFKDQFLEHRKFLFHYPSVSVLKDVGSKKK